MLVKAKDIMESLEQGIKEHGILAFYEKGAPAIMDFSTTMNKIKNMTMNDINMLFRELCSLGHVGEQFVYNAMIAMTDFFSDDTTDNNSFDNNSFVSSNSKSCASVDTTGELKNGDSNHYHKEALSNSKMTSLCSYISNDHKIDSDCVKEIEQVARQHMVIKAIKDGRRSEGNTVKLNAPTHNTDNILRVLQISQKHFELI